MKKLMKFLSLGFLMFSIVGCSCTKDEVVVSSLEKTANVSNKKLTTQEIYDYIRENDAASVNKWFITKLMDEILNIPDDEEDPKKQVYILKVKEHFEEKYLDNDSYKINGVFNEEKLVSSLKADMYDIDTSSVLTSGITYDLGLKYDYSDYIERTVNYEVYLEMLKEDYITKNRSELLDNSKTRIISIFASDELEEMEEIVSDLFEGKYDSFEDLEELKKEEAKSQIGKEYCEYLGLKNNYSDAESCVPATSDSTYDNAIKTFTTCENGRKCTLSEGLEYQIELIDKKDYISEILINKDTESVSVDIEGWTLYNEALVQLLRADVETQLHKVIDGEDYFLINSIHSNNANFNEKDIILSEGHPEGDYTLGDTATRANKFYLITVRVVDSETEDLEDKEWAYSQLIDKVSETVVILEYLKDLNVEITDPQLKEYYSDLVGEN